MNMNIKDEVLDRKIEEIEKTIPEKIDVSRFQSISTDDLVKVLGLTIKHDNENKLLTFLCQVSAFTEGSQLNISFNAPSSTGKSYIPMEIANLFPKEDVLKTGYCSPTAFFHDFGEYSKEKQGYTVDLSRKILIFLDQPHTMLLQHLRPLLSHDEKEIHIKITDKSQKAGLRTKNIFLKGYPAVIFCTAGLRIDEQESTRFLLLSPEISQEKIREAILAKITKESNLESYKSWLEEMPERKLLKERILAIRQANIKEIKIGNPEKIEEFFVKDDKFLKPRHQRDVGRIISLVKIFALLNLWFREKQGSAIVANENDVKEAFNIWDKIQESQDLNLPPYIYKIYQDIILPAWKAKNEPDNLVSQEPIGISRQEIIKKHYEIYRRMIPDWQLRQQIIPALEISGLIYQESDINDKRKMLIFPSNNSELSSGVTPTL